ncbi:unnamed protein product [Rotaria socialis]
MSQSSTPIANNNGIQVIDPPLLRTIKLSLFAVGVPISMSCYFFIIYQLLSHRTLREGLNNHAIIVNLCFNLIVVMVDLPFILSYLHLAYVIPATEAHCLVWQFVDYGIWFTDVFVTFWASIERHILIFHSNMTNTAKKRLFVHWMPLLHTTTISHNTYVVDPIITTTSHHGYFVYICNLPYIIVTIVRWSGYPNFGLNVQGPYFFYMLYIPTLVFPFVVLATMPNLREKFGRYFHQRTILQMNTIVPTNNDVR